MEFNDIVLFISIPEFNNYIFPELFDNEKKEITNLSMQFADEYILSSQKKIISPYKKHSLEKEFLDKSYKINPIITSKINKIKFILDDNNIDKNPSRISFIRSLISHELGTILNLKTGYLTDETMLNILVKIENVGWLENGLDYIDPIRILETSSNKWSSFICQKYFEFELDFIIIFNLIFQDAKEISYLYLWQKELDMNEYIFLLNKIIKELGSKFAINSLEVERATLIFKYW